MKLCSKSTMSHFSSLKLHNWGQTNILCTTNKMKMIWYHRTRHRLLQKPNFTFFGFFAPSNRYWGHVFALKSGNRFRAGLNFDQFLEEGEHYIHISFFLLDGTKYLELNNWTLVTISNNGILHKNWWHVFSWCNSV